MAAFWAHDLTPLSRITPFLKRVYQVCLPQDVVLRNALVLSLLIHGVVLAVRIVAPETFTFKSGTPSLEVVLVNAKTTVAPTKADLLAQVSMLAGGEHEQGRATSPLPPVPDIDTGDALQKSQQHVKQLEQAQQRLLAQLRKTRQHVTAKTAQKKNESRVDELVSGDDLMLNAKQMARQFALIEKDVNDYNKRPRKGVFGVNVKADSAAQYVSAWQDKIERIGSLNYPAAARGKYYGQLILTVYIKFDGMIDHIDIDRSSGIKILDDAALRIVRMGEPYAKFPPDMRKELDVLVLSRTWIFTNDTLKTQVR